MKKFRSIKRQLRRGNLEAKLDTALQQVVFYRKANNGIPIRYFG